MWCDPLIWLFWFTEFQVNRILSHVERASLDAKRQREATWEVCILVQRHRSDSRYGGCQEGRGSLPGWRRIPCTRSDRPSQILMKLFHTFMLFFCF